MKRAPLLLVLFLAACTGTSPEPDYYALAPVDGATLSGLKLSIKVERPSLPSYLDRPDMVQEENAYEYKVNEFRRWIEPLDRMFERILADDLRRRFPAGTVLSGADAGTTKSRYIVETAIEQFNAVDRKTTRLRALLSIRDTAGLDPVAPQMVELTGPAAGSAPALAAALSNLIAAYADRIQTVFQRQALDRQQKQESCP